MTISKRQGKNRTSYGVKVYDPATKGKRWVGTFSTLRDARAAERDAMSEVASEVPGSNRDCAAYALWWLDFKAPGQAASTRNTNRYALKAFMDDFRGVTLASVDRRMAEDWATADVIGRTSNARVAQAMFTKAIERGDHPGPNPFAGLAKSKRRRRQVQSDWLTPAEVHALADLALDT